MGLKTRIADWALSVRAEETESRELDTMDPLLAVLLRQDTITRAKAMDIPAFAGCVRFISETVAGLPVRLYREIDGEVEEVQGDARVALLNDDTGDLLNGWQLKQALAADLVIDGGGYAYIERSLNSAISLHYIARQHISFLPGTDPIRKSCSIAVNGTRYNDFCFVKAVRNTADGVRGEGILQKNQLALALAYNTIKYENALIKTGGNRRGFIKSEKKLEKDALAQLREKWREFNETEKATMMVLNAGLSFQETSATSVEMQLSERKKTISDDICSLFGVSRAVLGGSPTDEEYAAAVKLAVLPALASIEAALNHDLLLVAEQDSHYFSFDTKELLRGSIDKRFSAYKAAIDANVLQIDEARYMENLPPLGLTFVKLGLQDVLYDPETRKFFIPNMNASGDFEGAAAPMVEERYVDYIKEADGKMNGSRPSGGSGKNAFTSPGSGGKMDYRKQLGELADPKYPDGTYDLETLADISYPDGYQVTFCQIGDAYTDKEFSDLAAEFIGYSSGKKADAGKFKSAPEISFNVRDFKQAYDLGVKWNQVNILNWKKRAEDMAIGIKYSDDWFISTGGTGIRR